MKQFIVPTSPKSAERVASTSHNVFPSIVLSVTFGLISGISGFFIAANVLDNFSNDQSRDRIFFSASRSEQSIVMQSPEVVDQVVSVYSREPLLDEPDAWIGNAVTLTADGWFVMPTAVFPSTTNGESAVVMLPNGETQPITASVDDLLTGMTFFSVEAENLSVITFPAAKRLTVGQTVSVIEQHGSELVIYERFVARSAVESGTSRTTELGVLPRLDTGPSTHAVGSPAFFSGGNLAGIVMENGSVLPGEWIAGVVEEVVRSKTVTRSTLDILSVNLSLLSADERATRGLPDQGILVTDGDRTLQTNDVIQAINGTRVDATTQLRDEVHSRPMGSTLYLNILRTGQELAVELVL